MSSPVDFALSLLSADHASDDLLTTLRPGTATPCRVRCHNFGKMPMVFNKGGCSLIVSIDINGLQIPPFPLKNDLYTPPYEHADVDIILPAFQVGKRDSLRLSIQLVYSSKSPPTVAVEMLLFLFHPRHARPPREGDTWLVAHFGLPEVPDVGKTPPATIAIHTLASTGLPGEEVDRISHMSVDADLAFSASASRRLLLRLRNTQAPLVLEPDMHTLTIDFGLPCGYAEGVTPKEPDGWTCHFDSRLRQLILRPKSIILLHVTQHGAGLDLVVDMPAVRVGQDEFGSVYFALQQQGRGQPIASTELDLTHPVKHSALDQALAIHWQTFLGATPTLDLYESCGDQDATLVIENILKRAQQPVALAQGWEGLHRPSIHLELQGPGALSSGKISATLATGCPWTLQTTDNQVVLVPNDSNKSVLGPSQKLELTFNNLVSKIPLGQCRLRIWLHNIPGIEEEVLFLPVSRRVCPSDESVHAESILSSGTHLVAGQALFSPHRKYKVVLQKEDGHLVVYGLKDHDEPPTVKIIEARYEAVDDSALGVDVTERVACLAEIMTRWDVGVRIPVKDDVLVGARMRVDTSWTTAISQLWSSSHYMGGDPAPGKKKKLVVRYKVNGTPEKLTSVEQDGDVILVDAQPVWASGTLWTGSPGPAKLVLSVTGDLLVVDTAGTIRWRAKAFSPGTHNVCQLTDDGQLSLIATDRVTGAKKSYWSVKMKK